LNNRKVLGTLSVQPFENIAPSSWSVPERLALMDALGVETQILYPNGIGFSSNHLFAIEDIKQRSMALQVYNDFLIDVQNESGGRLLPQAMIPIWDMDFTIKEMTRLIEKGITGFTMSDRPEMIGLPELPEPYFEPMWDLFNESGAVPNFHIQSGARREEHEAMRVAITNERDNVQPKEEEEEATSYSANAAWRTFGPQRHMATMISQGYMSNARIIVNLCMSNLFDRFPKLKIVSAESGIGWVPFVLEALEYQFDEMVTDPAELALAKYRPTEYFREHMYVMYWFEKVGVQKLVEDIGLNNILVETDIPHPTCLYPGTRNRLGESMGGLDYHTKERLLRGNAVDLYRLGT